MRQKGNHIPISPTSTKLRRACIVTCLLPFLGSNSAIAQSTPKPGDPVVVGQDRKFESFKLRNMDAAIELRYTRNSNTRTNAGSKITDTEDLARYFLDLSFDAYYGHPDLLKLDIDFILEIRNEKFDNESTGISERNDKIQPFFNIQALMLGNSQTPITAYTRRNQIILNRDFGGSIDSTTTEYGVGFQYRTQLFTGSAKYSRRDQDQTDRLGVSDSRQIQDTITLLGDLRISDSQSLNLGYGFETSDVEGRFGGNSYDRHNSSLTHTWRFGPKLLQSLRSFVSYFDQSGNFGQTQLRWDERLDLRHGKNLTSRWDIAFDRNQQQQLTNDFLSGGIIIQHQLFESLQTTANTRASRQESDTGPTSDRYEGSLTWDYTKKVPLARLNIITSIGANRQSNSAFGSPLQILAQSETFADPTPIVLNRRNIDPTTIRVTDSTGTLLYTEGLDYTINVLPDRIEIRRVIGGAIAAGDLALIDYIVAPEPQNTLDTVFGNANVRYTFTQGILTGLTFYASYQESDQTIDTTDPSQFILNDIRSTIYGTEYRRKGLFLSAEGQTNDSEISPFEAIRLEARLSERYGRSSLLSAGIKYDKLDFTDDGTQSQLARITGTWATPVTDELRLDLDISYRDERIDFAEDTTGFEQQLDLNWRRRQTSVYLNLRNSWLFGQTQDTTFLSLTLGFRREF